MLSGTDPQSVFFCISEGRSRGERGDIHVAFAIKDRKHQAGGGSFERRKNDAGRGTPAMLARRPAAQPEARTPCDPASVPLSHSLAVGQWDSRMKRSGGAGWPGQTRTTPWVSVLSVRRQGRFPGRWRAMSVLPMGGSAYGRPGADASSIPGPAPDLPADQPCRQRDDGLDHGLSISAIQIYYKRQWLTEVRWRKGGDSNPRCP